MLVILAYYLCIYHDILSITESMDYGHCIIRNIIKLWLYIHTQTKFRTKRLNKFIPGNMNDIRVNKQPPLGIHMSGLLLKGIPQDTRLPSEVCLTFGHCAIKAYPTIYLSSQFLRHRARGPWS